MKKLIIAVICMSLIMVGGNAFAQERIGFSNGPSATANVEDVQAEAVYAPTDNSVNNVYDRKFVNPGVYPMPQTNGFFTSPTPDSSFRGMQEFLAIFGDGESVILSDGAVDQLAKGGFDTEVNYQIVNDETIVARANFQGTKYIKITLKKPAAAKVVAIVDGEADDNDTNSLMVLGQMAQEALKDGCNVLVITAEGAHRAVEASGWGIGTAVTGGAVNQSGKEAVAGGGGTGYSSNGTMTEDMPWLQGYAAVDATAPELAKVVIADPVVQTGNHTDYGVVGKGGLTKAEADALIAGK
jgi:hypothetical protein